MKFSWCCITYCRPIHLGEMVECFLKQDYPDRELVILNTFPQQTLNFNHPLVKVVNCQIRPATLGEMRNMCIAHATGDWIITADDDDLYLPHYTSTFAKHIHHGHHWCWQDKEFYSEGWRIKGISHGTPNTFAFTKEAWKKVNGYNMQNVGEDQSFVGKITQAFAGHRAKLANEEIGFIRGFDNEVYHVSGRGEASDALQKMEEHVAQLIQQDREKTGDITIEPKWQRDHFASVKSFLYGLDQINQGKKGAWGIVELGRAGDIFNILPVAKYIADKWGKPHFFVSKQFALVLDGVSYVIPEPLDLPYDQINDAVTVARKRCQFVLNTQVWGKNFNTDREAPQYNVESWRMAGFMRQFNEKKGFPLVLDKRSPEREEKLLSAIPVGRPILLLHLTSAVSSPFAEGRQLHDMLAARWASNYQVVNLCEVVAERAYDLLSLMEKAAVLITADTMPMHLATACNVPVIALVNPSLWGGTVPRCNAVLRIPYNQAMNRLGQINALLENPAALKREPLPEPTKRQRVPPHLVKVIHAVERHPVGNANELPRHQKAWKSWEVIYKSGVLPAHYENYTRTACDIGDRRAMPFFKDIINHGLSLATSDDDIILWSNADNILHPEMPDAVRQFCAVFEACSAMRCEFKERPFPDMPLAPEELEKISDKHIGRDVFAATRRWWLKNLPLIGDYIMGAPVWDLNLAAHIRMLRGFPTNRRNIGEVIQCCELPRGYVSHEYHVSTWTTEPETTPSHMYNHRLFREWRDKYCPRMALPL